MKGVLVTALVLISTTTCVNCSTQPRSTLSRIASNIARESNRKRRTVKRVKVKRAVDVGKLEQNPGLFEGDIVTPKPSLSPGKRIEGAATKYKAKLWPNAKVYYKLDNGFSSKQKRIIKKAMSSIEKNTCINFKKRRSETRYIRIIPADKCSSAIGMSTRGPQNIRLRPVCAERKGTVMHEFIHALGFWHEQARPDRDKYVKVNWANIKKGTSGNFQRRPFSEINGLGERYDYASVMHYGQYYFSKNKKKTMEPKVPGSVIGQRKGPSETDWREIKKMYKC